MVRGLSGCDSAPSTVCSTCGHSGLQLAAPRLGLLRKSATMYAWLAFGGTCRLVQPTLHGAPVCCLSSHALGHVGLLSAGILLLMSGFVTRGYCLGVLFTTVLLVPLHPLCCAFPLCCACRERGAVLFLGLSLRGCGSIGRPAVCHFIEGVCQMCSCHGALAVVLCAMFWCA
jgi:hypothetical protein